MPPYYPIEIHQQGVDFIKKEINAAAGRLVGEIIVLSAKRI
jgi:hypothetical protein